jgi:dimethylaniline monooxygenase (N-oxide forming)
MSVLPTSKRHTMQVDFDNYLYDLRREMKAGAERARRAGFALPVPARAASRSAAEVG